MPPPSADPQLVSAVRDCLAGQFALAIDSDQSAVMEVLEHRLGGSGNRGKWQPLHDALSTLRVLKPHLREKLDAAVRRRIDAKLAPGEDAFSTTARFSASSLSLVSEYEVQEEIAVGNTTRRLREAVGGDFYAINLRLAAVIGLAGIADERSPAHPRIFARALLDVISELAPDTDSRLAAFSAHDPALLQALAVAFRDANALLAYETCRPALVHAHRSGGFGSPAWMAELATLDDLLWTLAPRATAEERARLEALVPSVRDRFVKGQAGAGFSTAKIEARLADLDRMHALLRRSPATVANAITTTAGLGKRITDDVTATLHVSSQDTTEEGFVKGAWFEFTEDDGTHLRARLNWLSPVQGACVFKETARNRSFALSLADLRARRDAGRARPVDGPGVAHACIEGALADMARERGIEPGPLHTG